MGSFHRNEEDDESAIRHSTEEETKITPVIAQAEAEQRQEFCSSSMKHGLFQLQPFHGACPDAQDEAAKENSKAGCRPEMGNSYSSIISPTIRRFEVSCGSDIYTSFGGSPEFTSQTESVYIYAESINGCDSSCSEVSQNWGLLYTEVEKTYGLEQGSRSETAKENSSIEVLFGSESSCDGGSVDEERDSDSSCFHADREQSFDSCGFAEAHWGSASAHPGSASSGNITDDDLKSPLSTAERRCGSFKTGNYDSCVSQLKERRFNDLPGHYNLQAGHIDEAHYDSPGERFGLGHCESPVVHFDAGYRVEARNFPASCFCGFPVNRSDGGHWDSPVRLFEVEYHHAAALAVGHRGLPGDQIDDLYNDFTESPVCYRAKEQRFKFKDAPELAWRKLRGVVTRPDRHRVAPFFHEMMNATAHDRNQEHDGKINKGFLFHPRRFLQARNTEYREGHEYSMLRHVQNGSYGDVFSVRDKQTGYTCAAKKIPLSSFSWEEVGTWSRLDSPRVLQLYGAVQEGPNVILFMDLKTGSLAQFLKARGCFVEGLALYYHHQVLQALEHLHSRKVIHLDVKVDNVLLSTDKRDCFLCDFGLSETLDQTGHSTKTFRGNGLRGTESHMSPEVARGDPRSDKADVWSSCCMLLHMLSGHQPWTRYYTRPLCLKIVSEPAPLWEIPSGCDPLTCDVIKGGLVKEPGKRDSATTLLEKSGRALFAVGSPFDLVQSATQTLHHHKISPPMAAHDTLANPVSVQPQIPITTEKCSAPRIQWVSRWREQAAKEDETDSEDACEDCDGRLDRTERWMEKYWGVRKQRTLSEDQNDTDEEIESKEAWRAEKKDEEDEESNEEIESDLGSLRELGSEGEWEPFLRLQILSGGSKQQRGGDEWSEQDGDCVASMKTSLNEINVREQKSQLTLACHRSVCTSEVDPTDKGSDWSDDLSSGVFSSYSSLTDEQSFNVDWSVSTNQPPSCSFEGFGVDIWVEDVTGDTFRIRERLKVKLGHVAMGISAQISMSAFSLATLDGKLVSPDTEVLESGMWLLCVPAPDSSTSWTWRIRAGKMEAQEADGLQSDTCSTLAA